MALSVSIRFKVLQRDHFTCVYCGRSAPDVTLEVDHIIPISKGGTDILSNLTTSCRDCNRGKSNTIIYNAINNNVILQKVIKPETRSKRVQILIQPSIYNAIKDVAESSDISINELFNQIAENLIRKE